MSGKEKNNQVWKEGEGIVCWVELSGGAFLFFFCCLCFVVGSGDLGLGDSKMGSDLQKPSRGMIEGIHIWTQVVDY